MHLATTYYKSRIALKQVHFDNQHLNDPLQAQDRKIILFSQQSIYFCSNKWNNWRYMYSCTFLNIHIFYEKWRKKILRWQHLFPSLTLTRWNWKCCSHSETWINYITFNCINYTLTSINPKLTLALHQVALLILIRVVSLLLCHKLKWNLIFLTINIF